MTETVPTYPDLDGELTFQLEDEVFTRTRGELAFAPRNVPHTFANLSGADARTLIICTPAGFERYFDRMAAERAGVEPPPSALAPYPETIVGPRVGEQDPRLDKATRRSSRHDRELRRTVAHAAPRDSNYGVRRKALRPSQG
jgi:hypothetical protein